MSDNWYIMHIISIIFNPNSDKEKLLEIKNLILDWNDERFKEHMTSVNSDIRHRN